MSIYLQVQLLQASRPTVKKQKKRKKKKIMLLVIL